MPELFNLDNHRKLRTSHPPLKMGGGDGTSDGMTGITREELDAKLALSEARTEKAFADVKSEIVGMRADVKVALAAVPSKSFAVGFGITLFAALVGAMAFGASQFGNGVMVTTAAVQDASDAKEISQQNAAELAKIREEMARLIEAIYSKPSP